MIVRTKVDPQTHQQVARLDIRGNLPMLPQSRLLDLYRSLRGERVLSVYIDGSAVDPAEQRAWRIGLDQDLEKLSHSLDTSLPGERQRFESCLRLLNEALAGFDRAVGSPGWAAFVTAEGIHAPQALPTRTATMAKWRTGPYLAPYFRALRESRPVVIVLADARKATIFVWRLGKLDREEVIHAHHSIEHPLHMGAPPRAGFHPGTHGATGHDMAERALLKGRDRMLADTAARVSALADGDAWILLGGIKRVTARLEQELEPIAPHRVLALTSLDIHASDADIATVGRVGAAELRDAFDTRRLGQIIDEAGALGLGAIGPATTKLALDQACVRDLYLTDRFLDDSVRDAEQAVRSALDQDATVECVAGKAAELLDQHGGVAAGLRFRPAPIGDGRPTLSAAATDIIADDHRLTPQAFAVKSAPGASPRRGH
jgi:hypothetical protein